MKCNFSFLGGAGELIVHTHPPLPEQIVRTYEACGGNKIDEAFLQIWKDIFGKSYELK